MKSLKIVLLTALSVFFFTLSYGLETTPHDDSNLIIKVKTGKAVQSVEVRLANLGNETTKVMVKNQNGRTYFKETVKKELGYSKLIRLENFRPGTYFLIIDRPGSETVTEFVMTKGDLQIGDTFTSAKNAGGEADQASIK